MRRFWKRRTWKLGAAMLALGSAASCSRGGDAAEQPRILDEGTVEWGEQPVQHFDWSLAEIAGFTHAVALSTTSDSRISTHSAARQGPDDELWFTAARLDDGAPVLVFGGAASDVDRVVLIDASGAQVELDLSSVPDQDWQAAVVELPTGWPDPARPVIDVVGLTGGAEVAREPLAGLT